MMKTPVIDLTNIDHLSDDTKTVISEITKRDGSLYLSKPKKASGLSRYIWRLVMFSVSPKSEHHCFPTTSDFDLYDWIEANYEGVIDHKTYRNMSGFEAIGYTTAYKKAGEKEFKAWIRGIEEEIVNLFPKSEWHGIKRWGRAMGAI